MRRKNEENKEEQRNVTTMIMFSGWRMRERIHTYYAAICVQKVRSRTDIKISSFHEDSEDKDCKKVWNEPRAAVSYITTPSTFLSLSRSFFLSSSTVVLFPMRDAVGGEKCSLWIFWLASAMKWWTTPSTPIRCIVAVSPECRLERRAFLTLRFILRGMRTEPSVP